MRIDSPKKDQGIALIIVMMVILVLAVLAGGFAYSMKVETKLARNTSYESDMEWLGRSGVERGKYVLALQLASPPPEGMYSAMNQVWAGGPGSPTNEALWGFEMTNVTLGVGKISVHIVDMERKFNLSVITEQNQAILERALMMTGADQADIPTIIDSYFDWLDADSKPRLDGAEKEDYLMMPSPYCAKNGPVDDIRELLLLRGMTSKIFWGAERGKESIEVQPRGKNPMRRPTSAYQQNMVPNQTGGVGLVDLFTPIAGAGPAVNINTASAEVLQLVPGMDPGMAAAIVSARNGPDGQAGTEDDTPFINVQEGLMSVPNIDQAMVGAMRNLFTVQSQVFEITVRAEIGNYIRHFSALVHRRSRQDVTTLYFTWKS